MNVTRSLGVDHYLVTHSVGPHQHGIRLDAFLKQRYRKRSREQLKKTIGSGAVTIKREQGPHLSLGKPKPSLQLMPGDEVRVLTERRPEPEVSFDYRVLYEDESLFVIDKPAQLPVHPAGRYFFNTLLIHLKTRGHQDPLSMEREYFLVHRIDKETSGVLALAKSKEVCAHLTAQFAARETHKKYLAIVKGVCPDSFSIDQPIRRATQSLIELKMVPASEAEGGLPSQTKIKRMMTRGSYSLVECSPVTGRQHQIRVHLDHVGFPIVGDKLYGLPESEALKFFTRENLSAETYAQLLLPRHALHAALLEFVHPVSGKRMRFESPLPSDLSGFLESQGS